jgi:leader peptidase (prepilin peptidase)/N-methyltransferase
MYLVVFFFGLIIGSFLNVCIYRLPRKESLILPPSHCPHCRTRLMARDLVPLFSYLWLKGRCRYCGAVIYWRYPLVELLTGTIFVALYCFFGPNFLLLKYLFLACLLIIVTFIDLEYCLIPDRLNLVMLAGGILFSLITRDLLVASLLWGAVIPAAMLAILAVISRGGMGGGDVKLAAATGFFLGWPGNGVALLLACLLAGATGSIFLFFKWKKRKDAIPFAPFFTVGIFLHIFWGEPLLKWYLNNLGFS